MAIDYWTTIEIPRNCQNWSGSDLLPRIRQHKGRPKKNVEWLCEIFHKDTCCRLDTQNHVTAIVSRRHLRQACQVGEITNGDLMANNTVCYPCLQFLTSQVQCLHGRHRLKAAEQTLPPTERWWTVELNLDGLPFVSPHLSTYGPDFSTDISPDIQNALVDEYANEKQPSDGEAYQKICQYQHEHNAHFQKSWWFSTIWQCWPLCSVWQVTVTSSE